MKFCEHGADVLLRCKFCPEWIEPEWDEVSVAKCGRCNATYMYKIDSNLFITAKKGEKLLGSSD